MTLLRILYFKVRLLRFKADLVKRLYLRLWYWDLDIIH